MDKCIGCQLANHHIPIYKIYENKSFIAILDNDPITEGHILILSKIHLEAFKYLLIEDLVLFQETIKYIQELHKTKLGTPDSSIHINEGSINDLNGHLHVHIIPRIKFSYFEIMSPKINIDLKETYKKLNG
jgi:histidine triad (HIT) family protein